ncbi:MAG: sigma factor [Myxococcota bacterium]
MASLAEAGQSDAALFASVAAGGAPGRRAQAELYRRHVRFLFGALRRQEHKLLGLSGLEAEDVVQDTFARAFARAGRYTAAPDHPEDRDRARRRTRAWLGRIAQNLIADGFRRFREVTAGDALDHVAAPPSADEPAPSSRPEVKALRTAFATLSERERDITQVSALYARAEGRGRLPNDVSAELCRRWGITNDNLRAIRRRALRKLRTQLTSSEPTR